MKRYLIEYNRGGVPLLSLQAPPHRKAPIYTQVFFKCYSCYNRNMENLKLRLDIATDISNAKNLYQLDIDSIIGYLNAYERNRTEVRDYSDKLINALYAFKKGLICDIDGKRELFYALMFFFIYGQLSYEVPRPRLPKECLEDLWKEIYDLDDTRLIDICDSKIRELKEEIKRCYDSLGIKAVQYDRIRLENYKPSNDRQYNVYDEIDTLNYQIEFYEMKKDKIIKRKNQLKKQLENAHADKKNPISLDILQESYKPLQELIDSNIITLK